MHERTNVTVDKQRESERHFREMIDALPAAIYTTDAEGRLTHFNPAAVALSGRTPELGTDQWCVSWKLYRPDGTPMPHDTCPMAIALKEGRAVRGAEAIAERPDGSRFWFTPYPTPWLDDDGRVVGGINMLVDITERKEAEKALAKLAAIIESSDDAIISKDLNGVIQSWNRGAERIFGYTAEEAIGQSVTILIPPERFDEEPKILERIRRSERVDHYETIRRRKDGTLLDISLTVSPIVDGQGRVVGASKIARDTTQRKQAEQAVRVSEEKFRSVFEQTTGGIAQTDLSGRFMLVNDRFCDIVGRSREELLCLRMQDITHAEDLNRNLPQFAGLAAGHGGSFVIEKRYVRGDGSLVWVENSVSALRGVDGQVTAIAAAVTDITARKRAEDELHDADRRKDEFLATLAHELRNPLAPILNSVQLLNHVKDADPVLVEARTTLHRQLTHLVRLVDDLLDVSRITRGKIELKRERVELASIINQAVEAARPLCAHKQQQLSVNLVPEAVYLVADPARLVQVIGNLLNNACRYSERSGRITISTERQGSDAVVSVADTGIGIPHDKLDAIFEMFGQLDRSLERTAGGLGIGLYLVKQLVGLHGGSVRAHSDGPGKGSKFEVRLPILVEAVAATQPLAPFTSFSTTMRWRVLVVDDNRDSARSLALLLKIMGNEVQTGCDGAEAIEKAAAYRPDVMLLDIGLPKLSGYDACREIRKLQNGKTIFLIALTGWGQDEDRRKSEEAGFDAHMVKPVDFAALTKMLTELRVSRRADDTHVNGQQTAGGKDRLSCLT